MQKDGDVCTLRISEAFPEDEGVYKCIAKNPGGDVTTSANLRVLGKFTLIQNSNNFVGSLLRRVKGIQLLINHYIFSLFYSFISSRHGGCSTKIDTTQRPNRYGRTTGSVQNPGITPEIETDYPMVPRRRSDPTIARFSSKFKKSLHLFIN